MMKCSLCGFHYSEQEVQTACSACPVTKGCQLLRCPNCGYETPPEPKWLKTLFEKAPGSFSSLLTFRKKAPGAFSELPVSLTNLVVSQESEVTSIQTNDPKKLQKLIAIGLFPGTKLTLIQKFPSYTFQMGHSQFVIDRELAECVYCEVITTV